MDEWIQEAAEIIFHSRMTLALTGAGISVESGIPDFRSAEGLWSRYDPAEYATISAFMENPEKVWNMLREMDEVVASARPNPAHLGMGTLEKWGFLHYVVTQNIDNLHQEGGSKNVIEYHGNASTLSCLWCGKKYSAADRNTQSPPRCACGKTLKPDVIFFGEAIPAQALNQSFQLATASDVLMVVGTSALVSPANSLPAVAKQHHAKIIEINLERTHLTETLTDIFLQGSAGETISSLVEAVKILRESGAEPSYLGFRKSSR